MVKDLQPRRALSRAAKASPSTGAYLDSAGWVKPLPTRVIFHREPICCEALVLSKILTPWLISSVIVSFDFSNAC